MRYLALVITITIEVILAWILFWVELPVMIFVLFAFCGGLGLFLESGGKNVSQNRQSIAWGILTGTVSAILIFLAILFRYQVANLD